MSDPTLTLNRHFVVSKLLALAVSKGLISNPESLSSLVTKKTEVTYVVKDDHGLSVEQVYNRLLEALEVSSLQGLVDALASDGLTTSEDAEEAQAVATEPTEFDGTTRPQTAPNEQRNNDFAEEEPPDPFDDAEEGDADVQ